MDISWFSNVASALFDLRRELFVCALCICLSKLFLIVIKRNRPKIPGPFPWPIIGNAASLGSRPHYSMQAMARKYGDIFLMKLGSCDILVLNSYETIKEALGRQRHVFEGRPLFKSFTNISQGNGIVFNSPLNKGKDWQRLKLSIKNHLHKFFVDSTSRQQLAEHIKKETLCLIDVLDRLCRSNPAGSVQPEPVINVSIANIICALMFGHRYDYDNQEFQDLVSLNRQFGEVVGAGSQVDVMPWIKIFPSFKRAIKVFDFLTSRLNRWMFLRTMEHNRQYNHGKTRDLLDTFIRERIDKPNGALQDDTVMAIATDVFGAAQDTLSTTVQWIIVYMMYFPEIQRKVQIEIDSILGDAEMPNVFNKSHFPYTMAVLHEMCRHCSFTALTIPHLTTVDTVLGNYPVPKGIIVFINQFAANHDPAYWSNPDVFMPERFLDQNGLLLPNAQHKYLLFSYGSRKCPGDELSWGILLQLVVTLFNLCEISSDPEKPATLDAVYNLSSRPKSLICRLTVRKPHLFQKLKAFASELSPDIYRVITDTNANPTPQRPIQNGHVERNKATETFEFSDDDEINNNVKLN